jgi:beta-galactosidase
MITRLACLLVVAALAAPAPLLAQRPAAAAPTPRATWTHTVSTNDSAFLLDGHPFRIISGEMHYPRVPRAYWRARMRMARAMGLNTITTYVFWDLHERRPGHFDFTGNLDVAAFVRTAQEEGLHVILRPGPYVCSEWDLGGLPSWLFADTTLVVRSRDERFLAAAGRYLDRLGRELAPLQFSRGGPIIAVQVENEYGSFGSDSVYMRRVQAAIVHAGLGEVLLYTADGPDQFAGGALSGVQAVVNFGPGDGDTAFARLRRFRPAGPLMAGEWWAGWFDQWGERHNTTDAAAEARELDAMLGRGYSVSFYMFHGGTTFGLLNGANYDRRNGYRPQTTSYDYDAALDEGGRPSRKFALFREVIARHSPGVALPEPPTSASVVAIPRFTVDRALPLAASGLLGAPVRAEHPRTFEALGVDFGYVLYRTHLAGPAHGTLVLGGLRDYAVVTLGGHVVGTLDRRLGQDSLALEVPADGGTLDVLVENTGRVNFGRELVRDWKGLTGAVTFAGRVVSGWEMYPVPLEPLGGLHPAPAGLRERGAPAGGTPAGGAAGPTIFRGSFSVHDVGDTWLDLRGWGKGVVWVNGHDLGRFWNIGPQRTLYLPGPWLRRGRNEVVVLDLEPQGNATLEGVAGPVFTAPGSHE